MGIWGWASGSFSRIGDFLFDLWDSERFKIWFRAFADRICAFDIQF